MHKTRITNDESLFIEGWIYFLNQNMLSYSPGSNKTPAENSYEHPETHMSKTFIIQPLSLLLVKLAALALNSTQPLKKNRCCLRISVTINNTNAVLKPCCVTSASTMQKQQSDHFLSLKIALPTDKDVLTQLTKHVFSLRICFTFVQYLC